MAFLERLRGRSKRRRVVVIGLDGSPFTFVQKLLAQGEMPNLAAIVENGTFKRMHSVWPTVHRKSGAKQATATRNIDFDMVPAPPWSGEVPASVPAEARGIG